MLITALGVFHVLHSRIYRLQREITVFNEERFVLLERFSAFQIDRSDRRTGVWIIAGVDRASFTFVHSGDWRITATVWKSSLLVTDRFLTVTSRREIEFLSFSSKKNRLSSRIFIIYYTLFSNFSRLITVTEYFKDPCSYVAFPKIRSTEVTLIPKHR